MDPNFPAWQTDPEAYTTTTMYPVPHSVTLAKPDTYKYKK